jgi:hypothetical protein
MLFCKPEVAMSISPPLDRKITFGQYITNRGFLALLMAAVTLWGLTTVQAGEKVSATSGNWGVPGTWSPSGVPVLNDNVTIANGHTVTVAAVITTALPNNLTIDLGGQLTINGFTMTVNGATLVNGTLKHASATALKNFIGDVTINSGGLWEETAAAVITFGGNLQNDGILTASSGAHTFSGTNKTFSGASGITIPSVTISGMYQNDGILTVATSLAGTNTLTQGAGATLNLGGTSALTYLNALANVNSVNYTGAAQTVKATPYNDLTLANSGAKTLTGVSNITGNLTLTGTVTATTATNLIVGGNLTVGSGTMLTVAGFPITVTGTTAVSGSLLHNNATGLKTYVGDVTINSGGGWTGSVLTIAYSFGGSLVNNGSLTANTNGVHTFTGSDKTLSGANPISISRLTIDGTYQNNGTLIVSNALAGAGALTQGANATLILNGPADTGASIATLNAAVNANTVYYSSGDQTVCPATYRNLILAGTGVKTLTGVTVTDLLSMEDTASAANAAAFGSSATLQYNTATPRVSGSEWISPFVASGGVIITNTGTITLGGNKVFGALAPLTIRSGATLAGANYQLTLAGDFIKSGTFSADTGTVEWNAEGPQILPAGAYYNAILSGSGVKSIVAGTSFAAYLSIAPSGSALARVADGLNISVGLLKLGGVIQSPGTWGSSSAVGATFHNDVFFDATTGYLTVQRDATPVVWTGTGDWFIDAGNWSAGVPGPGAYVRVESGTVVLTNSPPRFSEFVLGKLGSATPATLISSNWGTCLNADEVTIRSNGTMTLPAAFTTGAGLSNRVYVVCSNFSLEYGGLVNANGKGYLGGFRANGSGPGSGGASPSGAGHGGMGLGTGPGVKYGNPQAPQAPGSGGGGQSGGSQTGGKGGGAVFIDASGAVRISGTIDVNATAATASTGAGGGSGGSIYIRCRTFGGDSTGLLSAKGGGPPTGIAGAGGRIAVEYDPLQQAGQPIPQVKFNTLPGGGYLANGMGSLYLSDSTWIVAPFLNFAGTWFFGSLTNWTCASFTPSNSIGFGETNFTLVVTNDLVLDGAISLGMPTYSRLHCSNLILTNGGSLTVYAGLVPTPLSALTTNAYGALVSVSNTLSLATNSWIYPYSLFSPYTGVKNTNGSCVLFAASNVTIAAGAGFNADGNGHPGGTDRAANTWGNGAGGSSGRGWSTYAIASGGSHGGWANSSGGGPYGSSNAPVFPGSGGAAGWTGSGGAGGGSVRIQAAGTVEINGTITANGGPQGGQQSSPQSAGGSGGSIFIAAKTFKGASSGSLMAKGSASHSSNLGGAGGRIAVAVNMSADDVDKLLAGQTVDGLTVYYQLSGYDGTISVTNGLPENATYPQPGTALFQTTSAGGSFSFSIVGSPGSYGVPTPQDYGTYLSIPEGTWITSAVVTPADEANGVRRACIGWALRDTGGDLIDSQATTQAVFELTGDRVLTWLWTNEYQLIVRETTGGTVNSNVHNGWYTNGIVVSGIAATANSGYTFYEWVDDVPAASRYNTSINLTMDQPRTATASFSSETGETRVWSGLGLWENSQNWTPFGMAGPLDTAILRSGTTLMSRARTVDALIISNSASLLFTNWTTVLTANTVTVRSGGRIDLPAAFGNAGMSNRIYVVCQTMTIETNGQLNATAKGYAGSPGRGIRGSGPGWGDSYTGGTGGGGSHGGQGGYNSAIITAGGGIYGDTNAPLAPGSGGGTDWATLGGAGGGAIRLIAHSALILNGSIVANGQDAGGGAGSGGSIYITCGAFSGGSNAVLSARGGNSGSGGGDAGGGGGRIVVHYGGGKLGGFELYPEDYFGGASVTNGTGFATNSLPGTIKWFTAPSKGTILSVW